MMCRLQQMFQITDMTLESKVKVTYIKNLSTARKAISYILSVGLYLAQCLPMVCTLYLTLHITVMTLVSKVKVKYVLKSI